MSIEAAENEKREKQFPVETMPKEIADDFLAGTIATIFPVVHQGDKSTTYRCLEKEVLLPEIGTATLRVDYREFDDHGSPPEKFEQMRFDYSRATEKGEEIVGEVHLFVDPIEDRERPYDLNMKHREVNLKYRHGMGIGRGIWEQAESWVKQVATQKGEAITVAANPAQADVISWLTKLGYTPYLEDKETYDEWVAHPEHFDMKTVDQGVNDFGNHIVRENMLFRKTDQMQQPVRIWMKKVIAPS